MGYVYFEGKSIPLTEAVFLYNSENLDEDQCIELLQEISNSNLVENSSQAIKFGIKCMKKFGLIK